MRRTIEKGDVLWAGATVGVIALSAAGILYGPELPFISQSPTCSKMELTNIGRKVIANALYYTYSKEAELTITYSSGNGESKQVKVDSSAPVQLDSVTFSYPDHLRTYDVTAAINGQAPSCHDEVTIS